jgi:hypothetical protein
MRRLHEFKAARQRRDAAAFGSRDWQEADEEIEVLQHEIFDRSFDDRGGSAGVPRTSIDADDELGQPEDPAGI